MNLNDAYPSAFLKVDDLQNKNVTVTIESVELEEIGKGADKEKKLVIALVGKTKKFVCNKTNAKTIAGLYGGETDDWAGKRITLRPAEVEFQGEMIMAIRVSIQKPAATAATPPPEPEPAIEEDPDSVPF